MNRNTYTEKWDDPWFAELSPSAKLFFLYCCDKCDQAGFLEVNWRKAAFDTGIPRDELEKSALPSLCEGYESEEGTKHSVVSHRGYIFLPNFLKRQGLWPINLRNKSMKRVVVALEEQAIRFATVPEYRAIKDELDALTQARDEGSAAATDERLSREELKRTPKDWSKVKAKCMSNLRDIFRTDTALRSAFEQWWDTRMSMDDPLELPMWNALQEQASRFSPPVILEAFSYAMAAGMKTPNFNVAKRIHDENNAQEKSGAKTPEGLKDPKGWKAAFRKAFPQAEPPDIFWRVPPGRRHLLYEHDPDLEARVKKIQDEA